MGSTWCQSPRVGVVMIDPVVGLPEVGVGRIQCRG